MRLVRWVRRFRVARQCQAQIQKDPPPFEPLLHLITDAERGQHP